MNKNKNNLQWWRNSFYWKYEFVEWVS